MKKSVITFICVIIAMLSTSNLWAQSYTGKSNPVKLDFKPPPPKPIVRTDVDNTSVATELPNLQIVANSLKITDRNGNGILEANEWVSIEFRIENKGKGLAKGLQLLVSEQTGAPGLFFQNAEAIPNILPGTPRTITVSITATTEITDGSAVFGVSVFEPNDFGITEFPIEIQTKRFDPPQLEFSMAEFKNSTGLSTLNKRETINLEVSVRNSGLSPAESVSVQFALPPNAREQGPLVVQLYDLAPGETKKAPFKFITTNSYTYDEIAITVIASEMNQKYGAQETFKAALDGSVQNTIMVSMAEVEKNLPPTAMDRKDAIAVIIGNKDYLFVKPVDYAINDANSMKKYCIDVLGFAESNVYVLNNAGKTKFEETFGTKDTHVGSLLSKYVKEGVSDVFVFYSGHGAPEVSEPGTEKPAYFIPVDCNPNTSIRITGYPTEVFYDNLSKLNAKSVTVVLDACFSGAEITENASPVYIQSKGNKMRDNFVVLSSSQGDQISSWYPEKNHGMFTYFFLKAIHEKNADANQDNVLTFQEVYDYIANRNEGIPYMSNRLYSRIQSPELQGVETDRILVKYSNE